MFNNKAKHKDLINAVTLGNLYKILGFYPKKELLSKE